jgi:predicted kinase
VTKLYLDNKVSSILSNVDAASLDSFTEVVSAFQTADSNLNGAIISLGSSAGAGLATEKSRAEAAELVLTNGLASEASRAQAAELVLTNNLASEASRAQAAELVLTNGLASEASRALAAELVLTNDLASEAVRAKAAELVLTNGLAGEVSRAQAAEAAIQARIDQIMQYFFKSTNPF